MYGRVGWSRSKVTTIQLGVGVIGLGVGAQHARAFAAHPACQIAALCDMNAAKLDEVARLYPATKRYTRGEDLIDDPAVRVVSIAGNDDDHAHQIVRALRQGKHVFAEKPLCLNRDQLQEIVATWRQARGPRLSTNTLLRRSPRFQWLKQAITAGRLGTVYCVESDYVYGRLQKLTSGWRGRIPGYSVMLGGGVHVVDLLLWLAEERPIEVVAYGGNLGSAGTSFRGTDLVLALLRFESGLVGKVGANFASVYPHFHRLIVYGTEATFENLPAAVSSSARLWEGRDGGPPPAAIDEAYPGVGKGDLIPAFVEAALGRGEPDVPENQVFACVATCLAIDQSVAERRPIKVEYQPY
jgi:predicted dehydrogenase